MKWKDFVSHHRGDTDTDQCTDQEMVIYTKRVNQISLSKNNIQFGSTAKPKVNFLKTLLTCVNNALKQQKRKKKLEMIRKSVAKDITNAITIWEKYNWKDDNL